MLDTHQTEGFAPINVAYNRVFQPNRLTIGLIVPLARYETSAVPDMSRHVERTQLAEELGFSALWLRDVPFNVPSFGDAGQMFDPFVCLGFLAGQTDKIALGTSSIILPLRHPAHVAKAAASVDVLSKGRLLLGVASGDRPEEFPALNMTFPDRGARFRDNVAYMRAVSDDYPNFANSSGTLSGGIDSLPKPTAKHVPLLITGRSQQTPDWNAQNGDGWMTYPRDVATQQRVVADYRQRITEAGLPDKPVMQSLYVDLAEDAKAQPRPIHLGFHAGTEFLLTYLRQLQAIGVNHVGLNLRFNRRDIEQTMAHLARDVLPEFNL